MAIRRSTSNFFSQYSAITKDSALSPPANQQLYVHSVSATNSVNAAKNVALLVKRALSSSNLSFGQMDISETPDFVDKTADILAGTAVPFLTAGDGLLVQSSKKFGLIGLNVSTASVGGSDAYKVWYYNGSAWTEITSSLFAAPTFSATGSTLVLFAPPVDWAVGTPTGVDGDSEMYSIFIELDVAAVTSQAEVDDIWLGEILMLKESVAENGTVEITFPDERPLLLDSGEGLFPYFETVDAQNTISGSYTVLP